MLLRQPLHVILISRRLRVVVGKRVADPLDRLFADARNVLKIFWRKIRQLFQCSNTCGFELLDQAWRQARHRFQRRWNGLLKLLHLALDFSALFFFTLNINAPSDQLGCQPDVLSLFANGQRELGVFDHHFHNFVCAFDDRHAADLRRADGVGRKCHGVVVPLDDVDLLPPQFADDRLNTRTFHAHARADGVDIPFARCHSDFGSFAGFARNAFDLNGAIIDFRHLGLEQMLHQFRRSA